MKKGPFPNRTAWALLVVLILMSLVTIYLILSREHRVDEQIRQSVKEEIRKLDLPAQTKPISGYTPLKDVDYFDGENGKDATDEQVEKAVDKWFAENPPKVIHGTNGENATNDQVGAAVSSYLLKNPVEAVHGLTPLIQCNVEKNRWEIRYKPEDSWQLLNNQKVKCTLEAL